jgi:hypothetical protein
MRPITPDDDGDSAADPAEHRLVTGVLHKARSTRDLLNTLAAITGKDYAEEALSVVHSLNFRSALGIFFKSRAKFGGGFE